MIKIKGMGNGLVLERIVLLLIAALLFFCFCCMMAILLLIVLLYAGYIDGKMMFGE